MFYDFNLNTYLKAKRRFFLFVCFSKVLIITSLFNTSSNSLKKLNHLASGTLLNEFLRSRGKRNHLSINPASLILLKKNFSRILAHL